MDINLNIDQLVLEGITLSPRERRQLQASVETELSRLITENGLASYLHSNNTNVSSLSTGAIQVAANPNPAQLGTQIAHAVYRGLGQ